MKSVTADVLRIVAGLAVPEARAAAAASLARTMGCEALLLFLRDEEIGRLLTAPGFPQTLPDGHRWRAFLEECDRHGTAAASLPIRPDEPLPSVGHAAGGVAVVLVGVGDDAPDVEWFRALLPLLGAMFAGERASEQAHLQARLAREAADRTGELATVVDRTRRQLEGALAAAHAIEQELTLRNAQLQDQAAELGAANTQLQEQAALVEEQTERLIATNAALDEARCTAENASRAKSEFLATMSHELRTPLNAISGHLQLLDMELHGPITAAQRETLRRIDRSQRHLLGLINDVLNLTRLEAGRLEYSISAVPLDDVVSDVESIIDLQMQKRGHRFIRPRRTRAIVLADPDKLQQVLLNLLSNAVKFTQPGGNICLEVREPDGEAGVVQLVVIDDGPGIPAHKIRSVFEPFTQVDASHSRVGQGAGLGLAISRDLARGMRGDLSVRSIVGEGSEFTLTLRRA